MILHYRSDLKMLSRKLRSNTTLSERILWTYLRKTQMKGYRFTRQKPIENYIVDFYSPQLRLVIEIDGCSHEDRVLLDKKRDQRLQQLGLRVLRFADQDVKNNLEGVLISLSGWIDDNPLTPFKGGKITPDMG